MGKNIVIEEGGVGFQFTADKLRTKLVGGGTCLWGLQEETVLTTKTITADGTYKASDEGYYGYSQVKVSGIGRATGKDPTTGQTVTITTDPSTGEIVTEVLPTKIVVNTPPSVTQYNDGASINFSGMVIKAYTATGDLWTDSSHSSGVIPASELILPVTVTDIDACVGGATSDMATNLQQPIQYHQGPFMTYDTLNDEMHYDNQPQYVRVFTSVPEGGTGQITWWLADRAFDVPITIVDKYGNHREGSAGSSRQVTVSGMTYYVVSNTGSSIERWDPHYPVNDGVPNNYDLLTVVYGDTLQVMNIPVKWSRPGDNAILETSFAVTVIPAGG